MACSFACMLLTLTLHCIVCQEVSGLRTSRSKALQEAGPLSNCSQHRAQNWHSLSGFNLQAVHDNRSLPAWRLWFVATTPGHMPAMPGAPLSLSVAHHVQLRLRSDHVGLSPARRPGSVDATPGGGRPVHRGGLLNITVQEPARNAATEAKCLRVDRWDWFVAATPDNAASTPECGTHINALETRGPPRLTVLQERYVVTTPGHTALALSSRVPTSHGFSAQSFRLGTHLRDQLQLVGRAAAPTNMTFIRQGISARGFVAATPCLQTTVSALLVQGRKLADRLVASTPQSFARSSASDANWHTHRAREGVSKTVGNTGQGPTTFEPPNTACSSASTTQVSRRNASGHFWIASCSAEGCDSAVMAQNSQVHNSVSSPLPAKQGMLGSTEPVTAYLQRINDTVCEAGPLPVAGEWAPIFWGLDQAWLKAHNEALTTQTFLSTLSTFMMVKGQVRPSSTEAQYVRDIARNVAKVRLGLMLDK